MRLKYLFIATAIFLSLSTQSFATALEDNQIVDAINKQITKSLDFDIKMKTFNSCEDVSKVMGDYLKEYYKSRPYYYDGGFGGGIMENTFDAIAPSMSVKGEAQKDMADSVTNSAGRDDGDYSKTNTQVAGVDESDIIKTDGKYIYYYKEKDKSVYIVDTKDKLSVAKKIKLPDGFWGTEMYLEGKKLVILANLYSQQNINQNYYFDRGTKTYVIVYDITDLNNLKLEKIYTADGNLSKSRKVGDYLYVLSSSYLSVPYNIDIQKADFNASKFIPKKTEISLTNDKNSQNLKIGGKEYPYSIKTDISGKCNEIEYILPSAETIKKYNFSPNFVTLSIIDIKNPTKEVKTKVLVGDVSEIYMSTSNLYITNNIYTSYNFACPIGAYCIRPWFQGGQNTLIHKINIDKQTAKYQTSGMIPGQPLTQYSMDEKDGNFRIITKVWSPERETQLYILDKDLKLKGSLTGLGKGEDFKSSRYIGDKLYLVTFEQIDPLFVIDLIDPSKPKVLGELKIPGYSTYLHPYDENNLIGIGYDTTQNQWGGTINNGLKVDLYDVSDFNNPKQKYTLTIGGNGSYSEALDNPRMFMWNDAKKTLLLPVTLYENDKVDIYKRTGFFNGLSVISIDKNAGIKEKARITHINSDGLEEQRKKECEKYIEKEKSEPECRKLLDGSEYCRPLNSRYVPEYCYADSPIGEYIATRSWEFNNFFVKRALWIGDKYYSISDEYIKANNFSDNKPTGVTELK